MLLLNKSYVNNFLWLLDEYNTNPKHTWARVFSKGR